MPNITDQYTFNELCLKAHASAPWVKKVQRLLDLGGGEGGKGVRSYYSADQVHVYSAVKKLRLMDLEFDDIKRIYEIEKKLKAFSSSIRVKSEVEIFRQNSHIMVLNLIILLPPEFVLVFDFESFTKSKMEELGKLYCFDYFKAIGYIQRKAEEIQEIAKQMVETAKDYRWEDNTDIIVGLNKFGIKLKE